MLTQAQDVAHYHTFSQLQWEWARTALTQFCFKDSARILDLGCGDGKITASIARANLLGRVVGLDISAQAIQFAQHHYPNELNPNLSFIEGSFQNLTYTEEFDAIVSFSALNWAQDQVSLLKQIHRSLIPGGLILLVLPGDSTRTLRAIGEQVRRTRKWKNHFGTYIHNRWYYSPEEYEIFLNQAGFSNGSAKLSDTSLTFENMTTLLNWWAPVSTAVQHLPRELRPDFLDDVSALYLNLNPANQKGEVVLNWPKLDVMATK